MNSRFVISDATARRWIPYLWIIYGVGVAGLSIPATYHLFIFLVPVNILMAAALAFMFHKPVTVRFMIVSAVIMLAGYFLEYVAVNHLNIFGTYRYEYALGFHIGSVPPILGINWWLMVYASAVIAGMITKKTVPAILTGSLLMTGYDILLEPNAISYHFWQWENDVVPFQNYLAWWVSALVMHTFFRLAVPVPRNRMAAHLFLMQAAFFALLWLIRSL